LTIVHDVVTQNGGKVSVENSPNGGARFVVTLPAVMGSHAAEEQATAELLT
jgi:signal transduction histidine kinase